MSAKQFVQEFYKSDALIDGTLIQEYLHPEIVFEWHASTGFKTLRFADIVALAGQMQQAYVRSKVRFTHLFEDNGQVCARFSHHIKTVENPREEMLLGHFMVIWEVQDGKLYRGFQMSQSA